MLQLQTIREESEQVIQALQKRGFNAAPVIAQILELDSTRRGLQTQLDTLLAEANQLSDSIGSLFKSGKAAEAAPLKERSAALKEQTKKLSEELQQVSTSLDQLLYQVPNIPQGLVPEGKVQKIT